MARCNMDCLNCKYSDCWNTSPATIHERNDSFERDKEHAKKVFTGDMTRYIHNRLDVEEYKKARNREYDRKRYGTPRRIEQKRQQYLRHRKEKIAYATNYYYEHKDEVLARRKAYYEANKDEINRKRRVARKEKQLCT